MRSRLFVMMVAALVWLLDLSAKQWALTNLAGGRTVGLVGDFLVLRLTANPGAAFSMGTNVTWLFTALAGVVIVVIVITSARVTSNAWLLGLGGLAGGAAGNLTDRLARPPSVGLGHVVDFIAAPNFPVFNVADIFITCSVVLMFIASTLNIPLSAAPPKSRRGGTHG